MVNLDLTEIRCLEILPSFGNSGTILVKIQKVFGDFFMVKIRIRFWTSVSIIYNINVIFENFTLKSFLKTKHLFPLKIVFKFSQKNI